VPHILVPLSERVAEAHRFSVVHGGRKVLLDHILASPALAVACSSVVILNERMQDEVTAQDPILGSLHAPVLASFNLTR
jgi:exonuclease III